MVLDMKEFHYERVHSAAWTNPNCPQTSRLGICHIYGQFVAAMNNFEANLEILSLPCTVVSAGTIDKQHVAKNVSEWEIVIGSAWFRQASACQVRQGYPQAALLYAQPCPPNNINFAPKFVQDQE
jgi:hypothetical protein